jgi:hypothetical protein
MAFAIGLCITIPKIARSTSGIKQVAILVIFLPCMGHVVAQDIGSLWEGLSTHGFPTRFYPLTDHPANIGYVVALLLPLIGADLVRRALGSGNLLPWGAWLTYGSAALCALALLTAGSRNSQVIFTAIASIVAGTLWWNAHRAMSFQSKILRVATLVLLVGMFTGASYKLDGRWNHVAESISLGWDTGSHLGWVYVDGRDMPTLSQGDKLEESAYLRTAFLKEGLRALASHPFGTEINKNAFKNLIAAQYGVAGMCCAHNGWVDLGISAGIPAMILWFAFLYCLFMAGRRCYRSEGNVMGYALMLLVIGFGLRMLLDSTLRDHIILQFMLCAGLLLGTCVTSTEAIQEKAIQ